MERFVIVMPVDTSAYLLPCDDGVYFFSSHTQ